MSGVMIRIGGWEGAFNPHEDYEDCQWIELVSVKKKEG